MSQEIEHKFLVTGPYKHLAESHSRIAQGYICSARGRTVRVRLRGKKAYLTIKGPSTADGLSRYEFEKEITLDEGLSLMRLCEPGIIEKERWLVPFEGHVFEVDEFFGENAGLVVAEVELASVDETFALPPFVGKDVSADPRYRNSALRVAPFTKWSNEPHSEK